MKALLKVLIITAMASFVVVGCGDKNDGNNNGQFWNQPPGFPFGPTAVGDQFRGNMKIEDGGLYRQYLEESYLCGDLFGWLGGPSTCKWIDNAPFIAISYQSREFQGNFLYANVVFDVVTSFNNSYQNTGSCHEYNPNSAYRQYPVQQGCSVGFYNTNNNTVREAAMYTRSGQITLQTEGTPADNVIVVRVYYRGQLMGTASLSRIPVYNNPYQQPYNPYNPYQQPYNPYQPYYR